jgi:hypothetical protein
MQFKYTTRPECPQDWYNWAEEYNITDYKICWEPLCPIRFPDFMLPVVHFNDNRSLETLRNLPDPGDCHRLVDNLELFKN